MFFATFIEDRPAILSHTKMQIRVDVDEHIDGSEELMTRVEGVVEGSLDRYLEQIARVEVHLSQRIPRRRGEHDMCCRMEAYVEGLRAIAVSHEGMTLTEAIHAASAKLERAVHAACHGMKSKDAGTEVEMQGQTDGLGHLGSS